MKEKRRGFFRLFSEHSRDAQRPWATLPPAALPIMAGKELGDLTQVIPGPVAARAFLDRVTRCGKGKSQNIRKSKKF